MHHDISMSMYISLVIDDCVDCIVTYIHYHLQNNLVFSIHHIVVHTSRLYPDLYIGEHVHNHCILRTYCYMLVYFIESTSSIIIVYGQQTVPFVYVLASINNTSLRHWSKFYILNLIFGSVLCVELIIVVFIHNNKYRLTSTVPSIG